MTKKERVELAKKMLAVGVPPEMVAAVTELPVVELASLSPDGVASWTTDQVLSVIPRARAELMLAAVEKAWDILMSGRPSDRLQIIKMLLVPSLKSVKVEDARGETSQAAVVLARLGELMESLGADDAEHADG
jgi:hypothetical protein